MNYPTNTKEEFDLFYRSFLHILYLTQNSTSLFKKNARPLVLLYYVGIRVNGSGLGGAEVEGRKRGQGRGWRVKDNGRRYRRARDREGVVGEG